MNLDRFLWQLLEINYKILNGTVKTPAKLIKSQEENHLMFYQEHKNQVKKEVHTHTLLLKSKHFIDRIMKTTKKSFSLICASVILTPILHLLFQKKIIFKFLEVKWKVALQDLYLKFKLRADFRNMLQSSTGPINILSFEASQLSKTFPTNSFRWKIRRPRIFLEKFW